MFICLCLLKLLFVTCHSHYWHTFSYCIYLHKSQNAVKQTTQIGEKERKKLHEPIRFDRIINSFHNKIFFQKTHLKNQFCATERLLNVDQSVDLFPELWLIFPVQPTNDATPIRVTDMYNYMHKHNDSNMRVLTWINERGRWTEPARFDFMITANRLAYPILVHSDWSFFLVFYIFCFQSIRTNTCARIEQKQSMA